VGESAVDIVTERRNEKAKEKHGSNDTADQQY
jgi:hypothetical protein